MADKEWKETDQASDSQEEEIVIEGGEAEETAAKEDQAAGAEEETGDPETEDQAADAAEEEEKDDLPLFGRKKKKDKKDEKIEELTDRVQRQMAEFDNFRKRTEKEKSQMFEMGARSILEKLLPLVDNFERGLAAIPEEDKESSLASGMEMIYKQFSTMLEESGVKPIDAAGQPFNPDYHNAVMHVDDEAYGDNVVVEELQKGYLYHDAVLRYSMVKVAN